MEKWICIYTTDRQYKAELVKETLLHENIEAVVYNKMDSSYVFLGKVEVYVQPENEYQAIELLKKIIID